MKSMKIAAFICALGLSYMAYNTSVRADITETYSFAWPGHGHDHDHDHDHGRFRWIYAGQLTGPINGAPNAWHHGVNYCNTENPGECRFRGEMCYINSGYWWDASNNCNWFNVYQCR